MYCGSQPKWPPCISFREGLKRVFHLLHDVSGQRGFPLLPVSVLHLTRIRPYLVREAPAKSRHDSKKVLASALALSALSDTYATSAPIACTGRVQDQVCIYHGGHTCCLLLGRQGFDSGVCVLRSVSEPHSLPTPDTQNLANATPTPISCFGVSGFGFRVKRVGCRVWGV